VSAVLFSDNVGPNFVQLLGDDYSGALTVVVNGHRADRTRGDLQLLAERLDTFLAATEACPRCQHGRADHFILFTASGRLYGCSHGITERAPLAAGLPCNCPGVPES
jgi:hypothetical protein